MDAFVGQCHKCGSMRLDMTRLIDGSVVCGSCVSQYNYAGRGMVAKTPHPNEDPKNMDDPASKPPIPNTDHKKARKNSGSFSTVGDQAFRSQDQMFISSPLPGPSTFNNPVDHTTFFDSGSAPTDLDTYTHPVDRSCVQCGTTKGELYRRESLGYEYGCRKCARNPSRRS